MNIGREVRRLRSDAKALVDVANVLKNPADISALMQRIEVLRTEADVLESKQVPLETSVLVSATGH